MNYLKFFVLSIVIIFSLFENCITYADIDFELVLCRDIENNLPKEITDVFQTGQKIYTYLCIDSIENGVHKIGFYWYNTKNELQESFVKEIDVNNNTYNIWSWLKLKDSQVLYDVSFIGKWKIEIYVDDDFLIEKYFNVN